MKDLKIFRKAALAAVKAGAEIMKIYSGDFDVEFKDDKSPLTAADLAANEVITAGLKQVCFRGAPVPVVSEEADIPPWDIRREWPLFWLIDPLDGTKEFVSRRGEFTVNIAMIEQNTPLFGVVYLPVTDTVYFGGRNYGSFRTSGSDLRLEDAVQLPLKQDKSADVLYAAGSRSHRTDRFNGWVETEAAARGCSRVEVVTAGSSLKFCLAAEGAVDVYPRFGPTMEWDTAAAQAIAEGAGLSCTLPDGSPMLYNKEEMKNDGFIVK